MVVDCQNRVTQIEITHKNFENKMKHEQSKITNNYDIIKHQIENLQKDALGLRKNIEIISDDLQNSNEQIEKSKELTTELTLKTKTEMSELMFRLRKDIKDVSDIANQQHSSLASYNSTLTRYDIIISDCQYKVDKALNYVKTIEGAKANQKEVIPKLARLEREIANLRVAVRRDIGAGEGIDRDTDIYLQTTPSKSIANDNLKLFAKVSLFFLEWVLGIKPNNVNLFDLRNHTYI